MYVKTNSQVEILKCRITLIGGERQPAPITDGIDRTKETERR